MNRDTAASLLAERAESERDTSKPQHPNPDRRMPADIMRELELDRFEKRLAEAGMSEEAVTGQWPLPSWFSRHRRRFAEHMARRYSRPGAEPPCKHWERDIKCSSDMRAILREVWTACLPKWAMQYEYLAAPGRKCGCRKCSPPAKDPIKDYDWGAPIDARWG